MTSEIIDIFVKLGEKIKTLQEAPESTILYRAEMENRWFSLENLHIALKGISLFLQKEKLGQWFQMYDNETYKNAYKNAQISPKKIGVIMAGNIPAVGFHDLLCVLASGHELHAKLSTQDSALIQAFAEMLTEISPELAQKIHFVDRLNNLDAYIATGGDNSARYFQYYLGKKPNLIRQNRHSISILDGTEDRKDLQALGFDIFTFFGLGCRSIRKIFVPENYDFVPFFEANHLWNTVINNTKYANNYEYQRAVNLINLIPHLDNGFLLVKEHSALASPLAVLHYEFYKNEEDLTEKIETHADKLQLITAKNLQKTHLQNAIKNHIKHITPLGKAQSPELWDYADGADTMEFLFSL